MRNSAVEAPRKNTGGHTRPPLIPDPYAMDDPRWVAEDWMPLPFHGTVHPDAYDHHDDIDGEAARKALFVLHYVGDCHFNATKAAVQAGYSAFSAHVYGNNLRRDPEVQQAIRDHLTATSLSQEEVLNKLSGIARDEFVHRGYGAKEGLAALTTLAKAHGLLQTKIDVTTGGKPLGSDLSKLTDAELASIEAIAGKLAGDEGED